MPIVRGKRQAALAIFGWAVLAGALAACGDDISDRASPDDRTITTAPQAHLTCNDRITAAGDARPTRPGTRLGPLELLGVGGVSSKRVIAQGGAKMPLLVEPNQPVAVRIRAPERTVAFLLRPDGEFPPGRPSALGPEAVQRVTVAACPPGPANDPRNYFPLFVVVERGICAEIAVTDAQGTTETQRIAVGGVPGCAR